MRWLGILLVCGAAAAQPGPAFDVASVKVLPKEVGEMAVRPTITARRIVWQTDLLYLNSFAWNIPFDRITLHDDRIYRIEATTSRDATVDEMRQMMKSLLATRLQQKAHIVSKELQGTILSLGKGGLKVKEVELPANDTTSVVSTLPGKGVAIVTSHHATMDELAQRLAILLHQPVWNRTGVSGHYDYTFRYAKDDDPAVEAPSLENALRETLGINLLKKQTGPVDFLVVDSVEIDPGEN